MQILPLWRPFRAFHRISSFTGSSETLKRIKLWFEYCTPVHAVCGNLSLRRLPTRLVDVGNSDEEVKLVENIEAYGDRCVPSPDPSRRYRLDPHDGIMRDVE